MNEWVSAAQFHEGGATEDWRIVGGAAIARFDTGSFAAGVALLGVVGELVGDARTGPELELRGPAVTVRLPAGEQGLARADLDHARRISAAARAAGATSVPGGVQEVMLTIDAHVTDAIRPFWRELLGYREVGEDDLSDPAGRGPWIWFQPMRPPRTGRNRLHVDVFVPHDRAAERVAAALAAGGRLVSDEHAPSWWVLADAEGNEACVATWQGRD